MSIELVKALILIAQVCGQQSSCADNRAVVKSVL